MTTSNNETKKRIDFPYPPLTRRQFVKRGAAVTAGLLLAACGQNGEPEETAAQPQAATAEPVSESLMNDC